MKQCLKQLRKENNIDIVRRITGGGAVYHDKEITYSLIIPETDFITKDILASYKQISGVLSVEEQQRAAEVEKEKYRNPHWNEMR